MQIYPRSARRLPPALRCRCPSSPSEVRQDPGHSLGARHGGDRGAQRLCGARRRGAAVCAGEPHGRRPHALPAADADPAPHGTARARGARRDGVRADRLWQGAHTPPHRSQRSIDRGDEGSLVTHGGAGGEHEVENRPRVQRGLLVATAPLGGSFRTHTHTHTHTTTAQRATATAGDGACFSFLLSHCRPAAIQTIAFLVPLTAAIARAQQQAAGGGGGGGGGGAPDGNGGGNGAGPATPSALVLAPTRELALQIELEAREPARMTPRVVLVISRLPSRSQYTDLNTLATTSNATPHS